jgi:CHAD domain-containing protein
MAEGKWIEGLTPSMPAATVAYRVLSVRFAVVRHYLPLAVDKADEDMEYVHQLRVGTRRAGAALRVFREVLPNRGWRRTRRTLRTLRHAAGEARDWDVFLVNLSHARPLQKAASRPAADFLLGYGLGRRRAAQTHLKTVAATDGPAFDEAAHRLLDALDAQRDIGPPFREFAQQQFHTLLLSFHQMVLADPVQPAELHQLRIQGKRLRYALEIFIPCFPEWFREHLYPALEQLQELLGTIQDATVGTERLKELGMYLRQYQPQQWPQLRHGLDGYAKSLRAQLPTLRKAFRRWRTQWLELADQALLTAQVGAN